MIDERFFKEIDFLFEEHLSPVKDNLQLRIKNIKTNTILTPEDMNYSKVFFDSDLNIYKIGNNGVLIKVQDENFEAVVMRQE